MNEAELEGIGHTVSHTFWTKSIKFDKDADQIVIVSQAEREIRIDLVGMPQSDD